MSIVGGRIMNNTKKPKKEKNCTSNNHPRVIRREISVEEARKILEIAVKEQRKE